MVLYCTISSGASLPDSESLAEIAGFPSEEVMDFNFKLVFVLAMIKPISDVSH